MIKWTSEEVRSYAAICDGCTAQEMLVAYAERIASDEAAVPDVLTTSQLAQEQLGWSREQAKLHERKTVHEWLNDVHIEREEFGRPLCLLRRLRILCDRYDDTCNQLSYEIRNRDGFARWIAIEEGSPPKNECVIYWHKSEHGGYLAIADEWRDEHHSALASYWMHCVPPSYPAPPRRSRDDSIDTKRHTDGSTHSESCWTWGPKHYECALRKIEENAEDLKDWEELGRQVERRLRHNDLGLTGGYPEMIDALLAKAKRLRALEMAMGELGLNPSLANACRAGAVQWITKRADEIMRGES